MEDVNQLISNYEMVITHLRLGIENDLKVIATLEGEIGELKKGGQN